MADALRFDGRVVAITGAGGGLGRAYALEIAARGGAIVVNDLGGSLAGGGASTTAADAVVAEIVAAGGKAVASHDDVASPEGAQNIVRAATETFGRLDAVIANAGNMRSGLPPTILLRCWRSTSVDRSTWRKRPGR
jgi:NAD(P)-dependent dehydrogenase (short-subunit alcohol dehydrogenase family)